MSECKHELIRYDCENDEPVCGECGANYYALLGEIKELQEKLAAAEKERHEYKRIANVALEDVLRITKERDEWIEIGKRTSENNLRIANQRDEALAQVAVMAQALLQVEWTEMYHTGKSTFVMICPACRNMQQDGHKQDCQIQQALQTTPSQAAERVNKLVSLAEYASSYTHEDVTKFILTNEGNLGKWDFNDELIKRIRDKAHDALADWRGKE